MSRKQAVLHGSHQQSSRHRGTAAALLASIVTAGSVVFAPSATAAVPNAPQNLTGLPSDGSIFVSWDTPTSDGGSPITGYVAELYDAAAGGTLVDSCSTSSVADLDCTLSGLTNGTTYYLSAYATNADGNSASTDREDVLVGAPASAPRSVIGHRTADSIIVSWKAPLHDGGSAITGYVARAYTSRASSATPVSSCTTTVRECTISGIDATSTYYVSVSAVTDAVPEGTPSYRQEVSAPGHPSSPQRVRVLRGDGYAHVLWTSPSSFGGSRTVTYTARAYLSPYSSDIYATCTPTAAKPHECYLGPLPNGTTYYVDVLAANDSFTGEPSSPRISIIPAGKPGSPRSVAATQQGPDVVVTWNGPDSDGGLPISSYRADAYLTPIGGSSVAHCTSITGQCSIPGLEGAPVYIAVTATTEAGSSAPSDPRVQVVLSDPPSSAQAVAVSPEGKRMRVSWQPPNENGRSPITSYRATVVTTDTQQVAGACLVNVADVRQAGAASAGAQDRIGCLIGMLTPGSLYSVTVQTTTAAGTYATSEPVTLPMQRRKPMEPRDVVLLPEDDYVTAVWTLPASDGGAPITSYRVIAWDRETGGDIVGGCTAQVDSEDSQASCVVTGLDQSSVLDNFEPYWFQVAAVSDQGRGKFSPRAVAEPKPSVPSAPRAVQARIVAGGSIDVSWQAPWSDGGYPVRSYVARAYTAKPTPSTSPTSSTSHSSTTSTQASTRVIDDCVVRAPDTGCTLTGFGPLEYVWIDVVAVNTVGEGTPSGPIDALTELFSPTSRVGDVVQ